MNKDELKPESPEEALHRMVGEENELATLPEMADQENAQALSLLLREKHDAEFAVGHPFESMLEYQRYAAHKMAEESHFSPDPKGLYAQGEVITLDGAAFAYLGTDEKGNAVLRRVATSEDGQVLNKEDIFLPMSELYQEVAGDAESASSESVPGEVPPEIMTVASSEEVNEHNPAVTEFSPVDQKGQSVLEQQKPKERMQRNFLERVAVATAQGEEIPLHVIENVARTGTPEEKAWASNELELRKSTAPLPEEKKKAENLFARMQKLPEDEVPDGALKILLGSKKDEERAWAEALDKKRREAQVSVVPEVQLAQTETTPTSASEAYAHETPDVDEYAPPEILEVLKEAGIHVPEGKTLTAFEAQKLMRTVLGARGREQIEANDERAAKQFVLPEVPQTSEDEPKQSVFNDLDVPKYVPPEGDETTAPLIERNLSGKPQFISELDAEAQGEAMQHLIDNTPEVPNFRTPVETAEVSQEKENEAIPDKDISREALEAKISALESLQNPSEKEQKYLSALKWLLGVAAAKGFLEDASSASVEGHKEGASDVHTLEHEVPLQNEKESVMQVPIDDAIANKFKERFALERGELEAIPGFSELSTGQQLLVLERMKSVAFDDINAQKVSRYRARIEELAQPTNKAITLSVAGILLVDKFRVDYWNKLKVMGMRATKQFQLGRMKDEVSAEWLEGTDVDAVAMKRDALEGLVAQALQTKEFGVVEHEGQLSTVFIAPEDFGEDIDEVIKAKINNFNEVANQYANKSFAEHDEGGKAQLKAQYESSAREMVSLLAEQEGGKWSGDNAAAWRTKLEGAVQMSRFFQDNPEVDKELEAAGKNIGSAIGFKNLLVERGAYSVGSAGARFLGISAMGLAAAPIVAAIGGGFMGWRRAKQELSENDLLAAMGEKDVSDDKAHEQSGINVNDRAKNVVESGVLVTKLEHLLNEYDAASETEKQSLKTRLEARVAYTTRKMEEGLIDLGSARGDRMERMSSLALTLGKAQAELGFADEGENAIEARLNSILDIREEKIEANRKVHLVKQAIKGATMGAAFSGAGMLIGGILPGHATTGSFGGGAEHSYSGPDVKAVGDAIRAEQGTGDLPLADVRSNQESLAKAFEEYMNAGSAERAKIAETLGMTTEQIDAKIAGTIAAPSGAQLSEHVAVSSASAVETVPYVVNSGDNLSHIMKAHLSIFKDLTPTQQENVIQNFINSLSAAEKAEIGLPDNVNKIAVGQQIQLHRLNEILASKRIGGEDIVAHAQHMNSVVSSEGVAPTPSGRVPEGLSVKGEGIRELTLSPLSQEDAAQVERALGRSLSGSESHVLHSLKGLSPLMESDAERQSLGEAIDHLQKEMQASGGRPLLMVEMQRMLHEHNGLDARIKFPEVVQESLPNVVTETAASTPLPRGIPEGHITNWKYLPESVRLEESATLGRYYLESDMDHLFGKDVFGNPAKEWLQIRDISAEEVFGVRAHEFPSNNPSIINIQDYVKAEGFTIENGYIPNKGESIEQFLRRAHATRVLVGGPRPQTH